jgi:hypothetical protein
MIVLAPGFYWVDAFADADDRFAVDDWLASSRGVVKLRSTVPHFDASPRRQWMLFEALFPAPWPDVKNTSRPTPAPRGAATTEDDTVQRPDLSPGTGLENLLKGLQLGGGLGLLLLVGLALSATGGRRKLF